MPLLADTAIVVDSWAPHPAPEVPALQTPRRRGLATRARAGAHADRGSRCHGMLAARGLGLDRGAGDLRRRRCRVAGHRRGHSRKEPRRPLRDDGDRGGRTLPTLDARRRRARCSSSATAPCPTPSAFATAAGTTRLAPPDRWSTISGRLGRTLPDDATIVLALDGENPWLHYPDGGGRFLRELMRGARRNRRRPPTRNSRRRWPASDTTRRPGHPPPGLVDQRRLRHLDRPPGEDRGLATVWPRSEAPSKKPATPDRHRCLLAEASDWFWWLGDDNPTELAPLYDEIFRRHLADACRQAGIEPPDDHRSTAQDRRAGTVPVPVSITWQPPRLDGRITSYFEWCLATRVETDDDHPIRRLSFWAGPRPAPPAHRGRREPCNEVADRRSV